MKVGLSNETQLLQGLEKMKQMLLDSEGVPGVDRLFYDESPDKRTIQMRQQIEQAEELTEDYERKCSSSYVARTRRTVLGRSGITRDAQKYNRIVADSCRFIVTTSQLRSRYLLFTRLAYDRDFSLIKTLKTAQSSRAKWSFIIYHTDISIDTSIDSCHPDRVIMITAAADTLIRTFGVTYGRLFAWWRNFHLDNDEPRTFVWNDVRSMARKLIPLLDFSELNDNIENQNLSALLECITEAAKIGTFIVTLLDTHVRHLERIRPCMELFSTTLFFLCRYFEEAGEHLISITTALNPVIQELTQCVKCLMNDLESLESEGGHGNAQANDALQTQSFKRTGTREQVKSNPVITRPADCIKELRKLRLLEIELEERAIEDLGKGSYAVVRKYNSLDGSRQYAVKVFSRKDSQYGLNRILNHTGREAHIWQQLKHKNINKLHGFCNFGESVFPGLVMDLCDDNLDDYCNRLDPDSSQRLDFMLDVTDGLHYLHSHPMRFVHGDLRPENILIRHPKTTIRPYAVLTDFGTADSTRFVVNRTFITTDGQQTPEPYRAPEFGTNSTNTTIRISAPADMYAFGCVFAKIVCGQPLTSTPQNPLLGLSRKKNLPVPLEAIGNIQDKLLLRSLWDETPKARPTALRTSGSIKDRAVSTRRSNSM